MKQFEEIEGITLKKLSFQSKAEAFGFLEGDTSVAGLGHLGALHFFCCCFTGTTLQEALVFGSSRIRQDLTYHPDSWKGSGELLM